jgi:TolB-like protein
MKQTMKEVLMSMKGTNVMKPLMPRQFVFRTLLARAVPLCALAAAMLVGAALTACSVTDSARRPSLDANAQWALLPIVNHTETPQAGLRAEAITESLLVARGRNVMRYPAPLQSETLFEPSDRKAVDQALAWAKKTNARYALTGAVEEWRYKVGVDGEPAVGVTLTIVDVASGATLWSGTGGRTGWSREALSAVAHKLIRQLLSEALQP